MNNLKENKKIIFIPGWLDSGELHGYKYSLDIWNKNINLDKDYGVDFMVVHSSGALAALYNWNINKNFKIILINPVLLKKKIFFRWLKSMIYEGTDCSLKRINLFLFIIPALNKVIKLFKIPVIEIINSIPKENLYIIYGKKDIYLSNHELFDEFSKHGFNIIDIEESGHNYDIRMEEVVKNIIFNRK